MKCISQFVLLFLGCSSVVAADYPSWWQEMGLILPEHEPNDYGVVNQGQLKNFGLRASCYMRFMLDTDNASWGEACNGSTPSFADIGYNFAEAPSKLIFTWETSLDNERYLLSHTYRLLLS